MDAVLPSAAGVFVVGRFPPPADGQTLSTALLADLLEELGDVTRLNTEPPGDTPLRATPAFSLRRTLHFLHLRGRLRRALHAAPSLPVVWTSISPAPLGHLRDAVATLPAFAPGQRVAAVLHRAGFEHLAESRMTRRSVRRLVERVDRFVFLSTELSERCSPFIPPQKRLVIPNAVEPAVACTPHEVQAKRDDAIRRLSSGAPLRLLFLSNMMPEKGYADVLAAVALLRDRGVSVEATFAGRWPDAEAPRRFDQEVNGLGLAPWVRILGPVADRAAVRQLHLDADIFVLPTYHPTEAQPVAPLEALAAGTPLVVTDRPAFREILAGTPEAGRLVIERDPASIAAAVEQLARAEQWSVSSRAARNRYEGYFSHHRVAEMWRHLLTEMSDIDR